MSVPDSILRKAIDTIFKAYDRNNSNTLDKGELVTCFNELLRMSGSKTRVNRLVMVGLMKKIDKDGDGVISKPEFLRLFRLFEGGSSKGEQQQQKSNSGYNDGNQGGSYGNNQGSWGGNNNQGGNWGGNQGGNGNWGGNQGGNWGGNQGGNGNWGGNQGGNWGSNQGGNWGSNQGGYGYNQGGNGNWGGNQGGFNQQGGGYGNQGW